MKVCIRLIKTFFGIIFKIKSLETSIREQHSTTILQKTNVLDEFFIVDSDIFLLRFTANGRFVDRKQISWKPPLKKPRIRYATSHNTVLYLSDMANFQVHLCTTAGRIVQTIGGGMGKRLNEFKQPAGLSVDGVGGFLVAGMAFLLTRFDNTIN